MRTLPGVGFVVFFLALITSAQQPLSVNASAHPDLPASITTGASSNSASVRSQPGDSSELQVLHMTRVHYPEQARQNGVQGQVTLRVEISEDGTVEKILPLSGHPLLIPAAVAAVKKWRYRPFIRDGKPVKVSTLLPLDFAFNENVEEMLLDASSVAISGATATSPESITVPAGVMTGRLEHKVVPVYPAIARANHIEGTVLFRAIISTKGRIKQLRVVSGARELLESAIGAVQQWRYRPYLVNGKPTEVATEITVNYEFH
jgi:TonB family protein